MYNHARPVHALCTKDSLLATVVGYARANSRRGVRESRLFDATPATFVVSRAAGGGLGGGYADFERAYDARARTVPDGENVWIIKPTSLNRGIGIEVMRSKEAVRAFLEAKLKGAPYLVQQYVNAPLLVRGRKFDVRVWVLYKDDGEVYMCVRAPPLLLLR